MAELHNAVSDFIRMNAEELEDNPHADIFIKGGYGYMRTTCLEQFIKDNKDLGYGKRVEVLKRLKILGALEYKASRPYDIVASVGGIKKRVYKFALADNITEEAEEEIKI